MEEKEVEVEIRVICGETDNHPKSGLAGWLGRKLELN